jgi:hypothetical protein
MQPLTLSRVAGVALALCLACGEPEEGGLAESSASGATIEARAAHHSLVARPADPMWSLTSSMSTPRRAFAASLLGDGRVLVSGGLDGSAAPLQSLDSAEIYDPTTRTWVAVGPLGMARSGHSSTLLEDGRVLVAGGEAPGGALDSTELFDPDSGEWTPGPSMPTARVHHAAVRLTDGDVLVAGGDDTGLPARLDVTSFAWSSAGRLFASEPGATLTALRDGEALLVGPNTPSAQRYQPGRNRWVPSSEPLTPREHHSATLLANGDVLIAGGLGERSAEVYRSATSSWTRVGASREPHADHTATLLPDGRVAIVGGVRPSPDSATEIFDPRWGTWTPGPAMSRPREDHIAVALSNGLVLVAGGRDSGDEVLATAEELDPRRQPVRIDEYKLPATRDRDISPLVTELWASVARPAQLESSRRYPVLLFLHGNHPTCGTGTNPREDVDCTYTERGVCPEGFVVVPSHRGYDYIAGELAARGYIVISVNANRGINCRAEDLDADGDDRDPSSNLARGRLLLKHLQRLSEWNRGVADTPPSLGASLIGKLDLSQVGFLGHSRGGEGARAAYEQYRDVGSPWPARIGEPVVIRGIFEIAPVDGQTPRLLNADGSAWNVVLPMCDGDVSDLSGVRPFDRMLSLTSETRDTPKSTFLAWGTNHNYYNTEWQESDSPGCQGHRALFSARFGSTGSAEQRQVGLFSALSFFLANVGDRANPTLNQVFEPGSLVEFDTRVDRGYTPGLRLARGITLEDFSGPSGIGNRGVPFLLQNASVTHGPVPEHDQSLRAARIQFDGPPADRFVELRFSRPGTGLDVSAYSHLELRVDRAVEPEGTPFPITARVQLVNSDETLSEPLDVGAYGVILDGPGGGAFGRHAMLQTVRIPLADFSAAELSAVLGVRLDFRNAGRGALYLASVRVSLGGLMPRRVSGAAAAADRSALASRAPTSGVEIPRAWLAQGNRVVSMRRAEGGDVVIELSTQTPFKVGDEQLVLSVGAIRSVRSRHPEGNLQKVAFTLPGSSLLGVAQNETLRVSYGTSEVWTWDFGALDLSLLESE